MATSAKAKLYGALFMGSQVGLFHVACKHLAIGGWSHLFVCGNGLLHSELVSAELHRAASLQEDTDCIVGASAGRNQDDKLTRDISEQAQPQERCHRK